MRGVGFSLGVLLLCVSCAEGGGIDGGGDSAGGDGGGGGLTGGSGDGGSGPGPGPSSSSGSMQGGGGEGGAAGGAPPVGGGGTGGGAPCDFTAPEVCEGAEPMPIVAGDTGNDVETRTGNTSKWFKVKIEEQDASVFNGEDLSYTVTLASPPGVVYDLRVYPGPEGGSASCTVTPVTGTGTPKSVSASWNDDQPIGGEDDSRWLVIEIAHVSGDLCSSQDVWTLEVRGNT